MAPIPVPGDVFKHTAYRNNDDNMMLLECKSDIISLIHLQYLFMKHAKQLFHTSNGGITKQIRAILYPFMQLYMYHDALLRKK